MAFYISQRPESIDQRLVWGIKIYDKETKTITKTLLHLQEINKLVYE